MQFFTHNKAFISVLFLFFVIFFRFYNLDITARFTQDESSDLLRMHQYYVQKKVTLVGPISNNNSKVFGSLTYYMLMPFAVIGNFTPVSPAYGMVFWGSLTAILLLLIVQKVNKPLLSWLALLVLIWYPLLETSRWAWNPHLVVFWMALGIWFYLKKTTLGFFLCGLSFSLAFHNHYIAIFATGVFIIIESLLLIKRKRFFKLASLQAGYILGFIPFVIFDLRHPPGLFFSHYLSGGTIANTKTTTFMTFFHDIANNSALFFHYVTQHVYLAIFAGILCLILAFIDFKKNKQNLLFLLPVIAQIIAGAFLDTLQTRYLLPALIFFIVWIIMKRQTILEKRITKSLLGILILGALLSVYPQLHHIQVYPTAKTHAVIDNTIDKIITSNTLQNVNIAQLASPASDTLGHTIRDTQQIKNNNFLAETQYSVSQHLLVVSTANEKILRADKSVQMQAFHKAKLKGVYQIDTQWRVYWFGK